MSLPESPPPDPTIPRFARSRQIARRLQLDRAVLYVFLMRLWQLVAGPVTVLLIARSLTPEMQGFYYAFGSLLAFQTLFDLNVTVVLLIGAGREWVNLGLDSNGRVVGEAAAAEQLASLTRFGNLWYRGAAVFCLLLVGGIGLVMFREKGLTPSDQIAWVITIFAASALLTLLPRLAILRGCHQILAVNRNLAWQAVCSSFAVWGALLAGFGLWAVPLSWGIRLGWDIWLVYGRFGNLFGSLKQRAVRAIRWKSEVWPLQWRLALQAVSGSALTGSYVIALLQLHSESAAGRMGMSLSVLHMLLWGGLSWVQTRVPKLSGLAKQNERAAYDHLFSQITLLTLAAVILGAIVGWLGLLALDSFNVHIKNVRLADRFLAPAPFALMAVATVAQHLLNCLTIYSRTRQREPFVFPAFALNFAVVAGIWLVAARFGEIGVSLVPALALTSFGIPLWFAIWCQERRTWA